MPTNEPTWTEERLELLKSHFAAGLILPRNRRRHRGEPQRRDRQTLPPQSDARKNRSMRRARRGKDAPKGRRRGSVPRLQYRMLQALYAEPLPQPTTSRSHSAHCCSLLELSEERCRWPISTPGAEDFCFCGNTPLEGLPYCAGHTPARLPAGLAPARRARVKPVSSDGIRQCGTLERRASAALASTPWTPRHHHPVPSPAICAARLRLPRRVAACGAARARHRAADAVRRLPRAGRRRRRLCGMLGQTVVHRAAVLPAARHSLRLRSRPRTVVDGSDRQSAGLCARPRRGAL